MTPWLVARVWAAEPGGIVDELDVPPGVRVEVTSVAGTWRFVVDAGRSRTLEVPAPTSSDERAAVLALVESLFVDLRNPAPPAPDPVVEPRVATSTPPPPAEDPPPDADAEHGSASAGPVTAPADPVAPGGTPSPMAATPQLASTTRSTPAGTGSPPAAEPPPDPDPVARVAAVTRGAREPRPAAHHPSPPADPRPPRPRVPHPIPVDSWLAADAAIRPGLTMAAGGSAGITFPTGRVVRLGLAGSLHPTRSVSVAPDATVAEATVDLELCVEPLEWLRTRGGLGLAGRRYAQYEDLVQRTVTPRASAATEITWREGHWGLAIGAAVDLDLGRILFVDDDDEIPLSPLTVRPTIRIDFTTVDRPGPTPRRKSLQAERLEGRNAVRFRRGAPGPLAEFRTPEGGAYIGVTGARDD